MTRIGVGGLVNLEKIRQAHVVLNDIHLFHEQARSMARQEKLEEEGSCSIKGFYFVGEEPE